MRTASALIHLPWRAKLENSTGSVDYCVRSGGFELPTLPQAVREFDKPGVLWPPGRATPSDERAPAC